MAQLADYRHLASGKVRELYAVDDELLLLVATDRISAFDYVLPTPIPDKGRVLTAMSVFWFELLSDVVGNHLVSVGDPRIPAEVIGRAMLVRRLSMFPVECVARGYLAGSGLVDYRRTGAVCGIALPDGLVDGSRLPAPIFTPATKAELGTHDENVSLADVAATVGEERAEQLRDTTLAIYRRAAGHAESRGVILADTKFEFGLLPTAGTAGSAGYASRSAGPAGESAGSAGSAAGTGASGALVLGDEVLTPDSSRFWPAETYRPGQAQPSFDKQYVRDWLTSPASGWDRAGSVPPPPLPGDVVAATRARYVEAYERITGRSFADWPEGG